jgi:hypothetical protein
MPNDLESIITELEAFTDGMLATTCWDRAGECGEFSARRLTLAARLVERQDVDAGSAERILALIRAGNGLVKTVAAMRQSVLVAIAETDAQQCFARELGGAVPGQTPARFVDTGA